MSHSEEAEWNPKVEEELADTDLQGIRFSRTPPQSRRPEMMQESRGLFVRNVPREMTNKDLQQLFSEHGHVVNVFLKPTGLGSKFNWAIVNTDNAKDMLSMMSAMNRKPPFNFEITVALSEDEKRQRRRTRGDFIGGPNTESMCVLKKDMDSLPTPGSTLPMPQASWNGAVGQVKPPWTSVNGAFEIGRGTVMMEGGRHQACVFCGSQGQLRCSVCKAWYCSMVCQVEDWYQHKNTCRSPPLLDDPQKVKSSLCGAGGEVSRGASGVGMSSSSFCSDRFEKDLRRGMPEEIGLCSSPKSYTMKEMRPPNNIRSMPEDLNEGFPKMNVMTENNYNCGRGAIIKRNLIEEGSYGAGRGAVPKRNSMTEKGFVGECDPSPKGSFTMENVHVLGKPAVAQKELGENPCLKRIISKKSLAEIVDDSSIERGTPTNHLEHTAKPSVTDKLEHTLKPSVMEKLEHSPKPSVMEKLEHSPKPSVMEKLEHSPKPSVMEKLEHSPKPSVMEKLEHSPKPSVMEKLEHSPKPSVMKKPITPSNGGVSTPEKSSRNEESASSAVHNTGDSSVVSLSENVPKTQQNFGSLLEKEEVYSGFITLAPSHEEFTAVVVVDGAACIFAEAHEILSTVPCGINFKPEVGSLVAAYSPIDETWYRARVLEIDGSTYRVCYIDFGNKEAVEQVKPVPEGPFSQLPELAFLAKLHSKVNDQVQEKLKEMIRVDNSLKFKVIAKKGLFVKVALCEEEDQDNTAIAEYVLGPLLMPASSPSQPAATSLQIKAATPPQTKATPPPVKENTAPNSGTLPVTRSLETNLSQEKETHLKVLTGNDSQKENGIGSPNQDPPVECNSGHSLPRDVTNKVASSEAGNRHPCFVVALNHVELILKLEEMSVEMNQQCESSPASSHHPGRGEVCLAKFDKDDRWYRALCLTSDSNFSQVIFVDYGNTEKVCHANIRPIPKQFLALPCLALYLPQQDMGPDIVKEKQAGQANSVTEFTFLVALNLSSEGKIKVLE